MIDWGALEFEEIKRTAWLYEFDDLFSFVENLHEKILNTPSKQIKFEDKFEIFLAVLMLADGILPVKAHAALANTFMRACDEIAQKKYTVDALDIKPSKSGRKSTDQRDVYIVVRVGGLKHKGISAGEAYSELAQEQHISVDTVRRIYERANQRHIKKWGKGLP